MRKLILALALLAVALVPGQSWAPTQVAPAGSGIGAPATTGGSTTSNAGQNWFLSQSPTFQPFIRLDGLGGNNPPYCFFKDDVNIHCFSIGSASVNVHLWHSADAGQTFTATAQTAPFGAASLQGMVESPSGGYIGAASTGAVQSFWTSLDGLNWIQNTNTSGLPAQPVNFLMRNVTTTLGRYNTLAATHDGVCRGTNNGLGPWSCAAASLFGYTGAGVFVSSSGAEVFAPVATNTWLWIGRDSVSTIATILRSTDDGQTWTQVFQSGAAGTLTAAIRCLSPTLCLAVSSQSLFRSTDAGVTWSTVFTTYPGGAVLNGIAVFDAKTAVLIPWDATSPTHFYRTADGGSTFQDTQGSPVACPQATGAVSASASVITRNGRALVTHIHTGLSTGGPCAYYAPLGSASTAIAGPLGVPWAITVNGGPVTQSEGLVDSTRAPWTVTTAQRAGVLNTSTTSAANTANVVTIPAVANLKAHLYKVKAWCSAGTSTLTVTDAGVTVWQTPVTAVPTTPAEYREDWPVALTSVAVNSAMVITLASCGVGNTGTLTVQADRF